MINIAERLSYSRKRSLVGKPKVHHHRKSTRDTPNSIFFSPSDLSSLLAEVNGDLEVAAARIAEGLLGTSLRSFVFTESIS